MIPSGALLYLPLEGRYRAVDELVPGDELLCLDEATLLLERRALAALEPAGPRPVLALETRLGRAALLEGESALLQVMGPRPLAELGPGARVAVPRRLPRYEEPTLEKRELALLALLAGPRAQLDRLPLRYDAPTPELADLAGRIARRVLGSAVRPRVEGEEREMRNEEREDSSFLFPLSSFLGVCVLFERSPRLGADAGDPLAFWCEVHGLAPAAERRQLPPEVFAQPNGHIAHLLRHLWASDGRIRLRRGHAPEVTYHAVSERLARQVQALLLRLEISAVLGREERDGVARYEVNVCGRAPLKRFARTVKALDERDERALRALRVYFEERTAVTGYDALPPETWGLLVRPAMRSVAISPLQVHSLLGYLPSGRPLPAQHLSRERAALLAPVVRSDRLAALAQSDLYWDELVSVAPAGERPCLRLDLGGPALPIVDNVVARG